MGWVSVTVRTRAARELACKRVLFVGTDMAIGKMTAALRYNGLVFRPMCPPCRVGESGVRLSVFLSGGYTGFLAGGVGGTRTQSGAFREAAGGSSCWLGLSNGLLAASIWLGCFFPCRLTAQREYPTSMIAKRFVELCAACHGLNMEGAQAGSLLDEVWLGGEDDESLARSIREGFPERGMVAWGQTLSEKEIRSFVIYIRERRAMYERGQLEIARPVESMTAHSQHHDFQLNTWVAGLKEPWGLSFLPDGRALVTELGGGLRLVENGRLADTPVMGVPEPNREGGPFGLFDVLAHRDFARNGWVYLAYSEIRPGQAWEAGQTRVIRGRLNQNELIEQVKIFETPVELYRGKTGTGGRLAMDKGNHLFFTTCDVNQIKASVTQDVSLPQGKIHRVHDDGRVPADNPFVGSAGAFSSVWSFGHRNPQGLAIHPMTGALYSSEHGPRGGDEINLILPGRNYGWPVITHGMNYDGTALCESPEKEGMEQPVHFWVPSIAPCGIGFYTGDLFPRWKYNLFVTSLAAQELQRLEIEGNRVVSREIVFKNLGRMRAVVTGPEGALYVLLADRISRLTPVEQVAPPSKSE